MAFIGIVGVCRCFPLITPLMGSYLSDIFPQGNKQAINEAVPKAPPPPVSAPKSVRNVPTEEMVQVPFRFARGVFWRLDCNDPGQL